MSAPTPTADDHSKTPVKSVAAAAAGPTRKRKEVTELERHFHWLENLRNEERTMKE